MRCEERRRKQKERVGRRDEEGIRETSETEGRKKRKTGTDEKVGRGIRWKGEDKGEGR